jgi:transcriptional regulator with XRE-family HTH domain
MKTHEQMIARWKKDPVFKAEYDALEQEFALFDELLKARLAAKLTQAEVAKRMGTKVPAISRMESSGGKKHSPSIATLKKYAAAVGCRLVVRLEPAVRARKRGQAH